jgi:hypothetical protein
MAFTSTTTPGGKERRPTGTGTALQAFQTLLEEPFSPLAHNLSGKIEALPDRQVLQALRGEENHLGAHHLAIR